ncbi:MAG: hypothetical protein AB7L66_10430 [Gemmatimonadales bacterium]
MSQSSFAMAVLTVFVAGGLGQGCSGPGPSVPIATFSVTRVEGRALPATVAGPVNGTDLEIIGQVLTLYDDGHGEFERRWRSPSLFGSDAEAVTRTLVTYEWTGAELRLDEACADHWVVEPAVQASCAPQPVRYTGSLTGDVLAIDHPWYGQGTVRMEYRRGR